MIVLNDNHNTFDGVAAALATVIPGVSFAQGLRIADITDPFRPREIGFYKPDPPPGCELASSNDVTMDKRGLIYLTDRQRGVHIIEFKRAA